MSVFCDLPAIADNRELISQSFKNDKWRAMEYSTSLGSGQLLMAPIGSAPEPIALSPALSGWQKIYIGFFATESYIHSDNYFYIKLSNEDRYTPIRFIKKGMPENWKVHEFFQEVFFKCADMTDLKLILSKPQVSAPALSGIAWIRCEEMSEAEIERYKSSLQKDNKCVQMHIDIDPLADDLSADKEDYFSKVDMLKNTNADFCSLEYSMIFEDHGQAPLDLTFQDVTQMPLSSGKYSFEEIFEKCLEFSKKTNVPLYATERMSVASFHYPINNPTFRNSFVLDNPQFHCKNRDGSDTLICSYAYSQVQDFVISRMVKMVKLGFKGISMILHRGIHVGFEAPVLERFKALYPDTDPRLLPVSDERLHSVWCEIMTEFIRKLRKTLDSIAGEHIMLNAITDYGLESAKNFGLDIEQWAREGLIDSVSQADMEIYEDLTDCMSEHDPALIDLDKYKKCLGEREVVCRHYATDVDKICAHIREFKALEEKYGIKVYHALPWVHTVAAEEYMDAVEQMKRCGAERFLAWNTNHMMPNRPEFLLASSIGNDIGVDTALRSFYRVLSLDGVDISQFVPNWRG